MISIGTLTNSAYHIPQLIKAKEQHEKEYLEKAKQSKAAKSKVKLDLYCFPFTLTNITTIIAGKRKGRPR
jgi:hypothetical protein